MKKAISLIMSIMILSIGIFNVDSCFALGFISNEPTTTYFTLDKDQSGYCGEARYNYIHSTGKLSIVGQGSMTDFVNYRATREKDGEVAPWLNKIEYSNPKELYSRTSVNGETTAIKSLYIGDEVTNIGSYSFYNCSNLGYIDIGSGVTKVGSYAFYGCKGLTKINFRGDVNSWANIDFKETPLSKSGNLFINNELLTNAEVDLPEIKQYAFYNCTSLEKCSIGPKVSKIGEYAFEKSGLDYIIIPENVNSVSNRAFYNCSNLSSVSILNKNCVIEDSSDTFPTNTILYGYKGSTLETYAINYGRNFVAIDNCNHDKVAKEVVAPTCINRGYTQNICVKCGEKWNTDYKEKIAHVYTNSPSSEIVKSATCSSKAVYKVKCDICGTPSETLTVEVGDFNPNNHVFTTKPSDEIFSKATCTSKALYYVQCDYCDAVSSTQTVFVGEPLSHKFTNYVSNNDATCTNDETKTATCEYGCGTVDTITVPNTATGHKFNSGTIIKNPTCTSEGSMIKKCLNDGCDYQETVSIPKKDHTYTSVVTAPTCKEQGYTTYTCSKCGNTYKGDYVATVEHSFKDYKYNNDATCTTDGTKTATCEYGCGTTDTITAPNTAIGHKFVENEKYCTNGCKTLNPNYKDPTPTPGGGSTGGGGGFTPAPTPNDTDKKDDDKKSEAKPNHSQNTSTSATQKLNVKKLVSKKNALVVYWNKIANASGYQIQVATDKKFKKNKKTVTVTKQNAIKKTVKKLKAKKKYFVRVRAYKIVDGKKSYGKWSKIKTVKTK